MARGRHTVDGPEPGPGLDPWANLARIEASLLEDDAPPPELLVVHHDQEQDEQPQVDEAELPFASGAHRSHRSHRRPRPQRTRRPSSRPSLALRRLPAPLVVVVVIGLVAVGAVVVVDRFSDRSVPVARAQTTSQVSPDVAQVPSSDEQTSVSPVYFRKVKLGVFRETSAAQVHGFENWLGRDVDTVVDFSSRDTWDEIADPQYMIDEWKKTDYRVVYTVAMLPNRGDNTVAKGATGSYDVYFHRLAKNLVAGHQAGAVIRLGSEFNLSTSHWATDKPQDYVDYFRHIVTAMRSVKGQHFAFDWNPNVGGTTFDATQYYPGNAYVDYVGVDVYDISWQDGTYPYPAKCDDACRLPRQEIVWDRLYDGPHGLAFWAEFARSKDKKMSLPEWGLWDRTDRHGGGDDPYFIEQMYRFIADPSNRVAYQAYFETNTSDGEHELMTSFPDAGAVYRKLFNPKS